MLWCFVFLYAVIGPVSVLDILPGDFEDVLSLGEVFGVRVIVCERVILVDHVAETVGFLLLHRQDCLLILRFQHEHLEVFLVF